MAPTWPQLTWRDWQSVSCLRQPCRWLRRSVYSRPPPMLPTSSVRRVTTCSLTTRTIHAWCDTTRAHKLFNTHSPVAVGLQGCRPFPERWRVRICWLVLSAAEPCSDGLCPGDADHLDLGLSAFSSRKRSKVTNSALYLECVKRWAQAARLVGAVLKLVCINGWAIQEGWVSLQGKILS